MLNSILFTVLLTLLTPLLNSGDDAFVMYSYSGAFGVDPSVLVDYNHLWHYWLGLLVTKLFILFPYFNWYTAFLLCLHFLSCVVIFYALSKRFSLQKALLLYALFFLFFEARYLLSLSFTNTSIVLALAGNVWLVTHITLSEHRIINYIIGFCILALSGLIRFHTLGFVDFFFLFFIFLFSKKERLSYLLLKGVLYVCLILSFLIHANYYQKQTKGWANHENKQQVMYQLYNKASKDVNSAGIFKSEVEKEFFAAGFTYDTSIIDKERANVLVSGLMRNRSIDVQEDRAMLYWIFMESRVYIFLFLILFFMARRQKKAMWYFAISWAASLLLFCLLFVYRKVTGYMFVTFFSSNFLIYALLICPDDLLNYSLKVRSYLYALLCAAAFWIGDRTFKINQQNIVNYNRWQCAYNHLSQHPSQIFVAADNRFPIDYFSVTDVPSKMKMANFISVGQQPVTLYQQKLAQLQLNNIMDDLLYKGNMVLIGAKLNALKAYYKNKHVDVVLEDVPHTYDCQAAVKVVLVHH